MAPLSKHRRERLDEALRLARGGLKSLELGTRTADADLLERAAAGLQEAGTIAAREAARLSEPDDPEPAGRTSRTSERPPPTP